MGCGCIKTYEQYEPTQLDILRKIAKRKAAEDGVWHVVVRCSGGNFDVMREDDFSDDNGLSIVEYLSPV